MVNAFFHPFTGGTEKMMYELARRIARTENLCVLTSQLEGTKPYEELEGMKIYRTPANFRKMRLIYPPPLVTSRKAKKKIRELDAKYDFDVINCHGRWFPDFAYSIKYAKKKGKLGTLTLHNVRPYGISLPVTAFGFLFETFYGRRILKKADKIISVSEAGKRDIMKYGIPDEKIEVIYNGVDTEYYHPDKPTYREKYGDGFDNFLVFQGRIIKQKGLNYLIDAMPQILKEYPKTRLLVVGKGKMVPKLKQQVSRLGLRDNIIFPGFIPEQEVNNMFSSADVFIMPSLWEVMCVALLEALSCGLPLLASDATGNDEIVKHGVNGFIFHKKNNDEMVERLRIMLDDKQLRDKMGKQSRKIAETEFDWDIIADKTTNFYKQELAKR